jgi:predicted small secreted protein
MMKARPASWPVLLGVLIALAIVCAVLAGCSSTAGGSGGDGTSGSSDNLTHIPGPKYLIEEPDNVYNVVLTCLPHGSGLYASEGGGNIYVLKDDPQCASPG